MNNNDSEQTRREQDKKQYKGQRGEISRSNEGKKHMNSTVNLLHFVAKSQKNYEKYFLFSVIEN